MKTRVLGKDLTVSAIGLGCMGFSHAYGSPMPKQEAIKQIRAAYEMGYTFFDTAECYVGQYPDGSASYNEELVGEALKGCRDKVVIATKFGVQLHPGNRSIPIPYSRPEVIRKAVEGSLKRLQVDCIDLYYQHRMDPNIPPEEVAGVMSQLIQEGKISHWGISEASADYLRRAHAVCPVTAVQNRYSMMARHYEDLFPVLAELQIGFVAFSPLANGFLSGKYDQNAKFEQGADYRSQMPQFSAEGIQQNNALLELLHSIAQAKNATPAQISLAWMLGKAPWLVPIPGSRRQERMQENADAAKIQLSPTEIKALDDALDHIPMSEVFGVSKDSEPTK